MSPLAAVALAREQGVRTVVHLSCRDRNKLALQSEVIGAAALGCDGLLCLNGDDFAGVRRVGDMTTTQLLNAARQWARPREITLGCVVNPFAADQEREIALLERKIRAGAQFVHTQVVFDVAALEGFVLRLEDRGVLGRLRLYASVAILRSRSMADRVRSLPGAYLPDAAYKQVATGGGPELAMQLANALAAVPQVDALHVMPLGDELSAGRCAATFRLARGAAAARAAVTR
jgi:methylenetetrahydrofolate reductase (NADPH)